MTAKILECLPEIDVLAMGRVTQLPEWYDDAVCGPFDVRSFAIHHPDGAIVVDAGIGIGDAFIDRIYAPQTVDVADVLATCGVDIKKVQALILTHLHFDHCGQARRFMAPVFVQSVELEAARSPRYTVPEWLPDADVRAIDGDAAIASGVRVIATPGHTSGHQSVVVDASDGRAVIVGQACHRAADFAAREPIPDCNDEVRLIARSSLNRLRSLAPATFYFSHDDETLSIG